VSASGREELELRPEDNARLAALCGPLDGHLRILETRLGLRLENRGHRFVLVGPPEARARARRLLERLYDLGGRSPLAEEDVLRLIDETETEGDEGSEPAPARILTPRRQVLARGRRQAAYVAALGTHDLVFGVGPAGTGKTYLAVAVACALLARGVFRRLVLVRPAVEAGERLGFLPGGFTEKVDPYLRPIYDALDEFLGPEETARALERGTIEISPLAYMRGRTLAQAFIILDEAQNTTVEQMKMFLTRLGEGSRAAVTGDVTQVDLPRPERSGLGDALERLADLEGVHVSRFRPADAQRHPLVARIVAAYERPREERP
jgi:phosphate starvation-inducible PhoH-like protein